MSDLRCCFPGCAAAPEFSLSAVHTSTLTLGHEQTVCADHLAEVVVTLDEYLRQWNPLDTLYVAHLGRRPLTDDEIDRANDVMSAAQEDFYRRFHKVDRAAAMAG